MSLETKLALTESELNRLRNEFRDFVYSIGHELSGPLRQSSGFAEMILRNNEDTLNDKAKKHLNIIMSSAFAGRQSLEALRAFSSTLDKPPVFKKDVNITPLVEGAILRAKSEFDERIVDVTINSIPTVTCDADRLSHLFYHLIKNAVLFQPINQKAEVTINCNLEEGKDTPDAWMFSVKDNGIGIIPHRITDVFKPFKRCHTRDEFSGEGLGLTISRSIVKDHLGEIWVDPNQEKGTNICFTLLKDLI